MDKLVALIKEHRATVLDQWTKQIYESYPEQTASFLQKQKDPFLNPVGSAIVSSTNLILDHLLGDASDQALRAALDAIVRVRAVQEFSPSQAVSHLFLLKRIVTEQFSGHLADETLFSQFLEFQRRIDRIALQAFDLYMHCREQIYELRIKEIKKWSSVFWERQNPPADEKGTSTEDNSNGNG